MTLLAAMCRAQDTGSSRTVLTNGDVITLAEAGFSEDFIIEMIHTSRAEFDTTAAGVADLKKHGVKEDVIRAVRAPRPAEKTPAKPEPANSGPQAMGAQPMRVFVEVSPSTLLSQSHPLSADIVEAFARNCPGITVTGRRDVAMFVVVLERSAAKLLKPATSRMVVFNRGGDTVYGSTVRPLGKAVRAFCTSTQKLTEASAVESLPGSQFSER